MQMTKRVESTNIGQVEVLAEQKVLNAFIVQRILFFHVIQSLARVFPA